MDYMSSEIARELLWNSILPSLHHLWQKNWNKEHYQTPNLSHQVLHRLIRRENLRITTLVLQPNSCKWRTPQNTKPSFENIDEKYKVSNVQFVVIEEKVDWTWRDSSLLNPRRLVEPLAMAPHYSSHWPHSQTLAWSQSMPSPSVCLSTHTKDTDLEEGAAKKQDVSTFFLQYLYLKLQDAS